ncbi:helix-turn-helix domain-containing protein [Pseudoalteromonas aurantia]|uniref:HTH cro/C1-type domain-containing protein n=1 Tax=Pseudoalteromonas aurantia TaxID=43654 RepID=A0A5S3VB75_9GAMM|nr:helix-turn-helix transcriptional regulator [Pseudoalteromonas aurantia]TMO69009.1 hypothetical protein CWC19_06955 [Pseudoalteromonas aurantia]
METYENQSDRLDFAFQESRKKIDVNGTMTAKEAYKALELSQSTFSAYRKGSEPSAAVLRKLTQFTGISAHWLVTGKGEIYTQSKDVITHITGNEVLNISPSLLPKLDEHTRFDRVNNDDFNSVIRRSDIIVIDTNTSNQEGIFVVEIKGQRTIGHIQVNSAGKRILSNDKTTALMLDDSALQMGEVIWSCGSING